MFRIKQSLVTIQYLIERRAKIILISHLIAIMSPVLSEGFFADKIVLVEGLEDKAALYAIDQQLHEKDFDKSGIAIIPVLGKRNLDRPGLIFKG